MTDQLLILNKVIKVLLRLIAVVAAIAITSLIALSLFLVTEGGSSWVASKIVERLEGETNTISFSRIDGSLLSGLELYDSKFDSPDLSVTAGRIKVAWNPLSIMRGSLIVSELRGFDIQVAQIDTSPATENQYDLDKIQSVFANLPIGISIDDFGLESFNFTSTSQSVEITAASADVFVGPHNLTLRNIDFSASFLSVQGEIDVSMGAQIDVAVDLSWLYEENVFESLAFPAGQLFISGDLDDLEIDHQLVSPIEISSRGAIRQLVTPNAMEATANHTIDEFSYAFDGNEPLVFRNANMVTEYQESKVYWKFDSLATQALFPDLTLDGEGEYTTDQLLLSSLQATTNSGSLLASGAIEMDGPLNARLTVTLAENDPLQYVESMPSLDLDQLRIESDLSFEFTGRQELVLEAEQFTLSAALNGNQLLGRGKFRVQGGSYYLDDLQISSAGNDLSFSGNLGEELDFSWLFSAPLLSSIDSNIQGSATATGFIRGSIDNPQFETQALLENIRLGMIDAESLDFNFSNLDSVLQGRATLRNTEITSDSLQESIDEVELSLIGTLESQSITLKSLSDSMTLDLYVEGGLLDIESRAWNAGLLQGNVTGEFGVWKNESAATLDFSDKEIHLDIGCWRARETELCFNGEVNSSSTLNVSGRVTNFPLDEFNSAPTFPGYLFQSQLTPKLPPEMFVFGPAGLTLQAEKPLGEDWQGQVLISANDTQLVVAGAKQTLAVDLNSSVSQHSYGWESLTLAGQYNSGVWQLDSRAVLAEKDLDDSGFPLNGVLESALLIQADESISGSLEANFEDLDWIEVFVPGISATSGELNTSVTIEGFLNSPIIEGNATIRKGAFTADRLGVTFENIESSVSGDKEGNAKIEGSIASGTGQLSFTGSIVDLYNSAREIEGRVFGSDFNFIELPDLSLSLTPDLTVIANRETIDLSGSLDIPVLNLSVRELPNTAVNVSRDVVILDYPADRPDLAKSLESESASLFNIPVTARVSVNLGSDVSFSGFGLNAGLKGNLDIQQLAAGNNLTYGELEIVNGRYELYRQSLEIRQGKLLFLGAYDNPGLDVRAVREVDDITAGVQMNGTLRNIRSQLFSTPALAESDIVSVLVTGRPFSQLGSQQDDDAVLNAITKFGLERGQGLTAQVADRLGLDTLEIINSGTIDTSELSVGKYVTPDLFVRYGIGLFDTRSKVAVDYKLTDNILLQAETGEFQSVDVTYKVEK